jgi:hypothetical protein
MDVKRLAILLAELGQLVSACPMTTFFALETQQSTQQPAHCPGGGLGLQYTAKTPSFRRNT